MCKGGTWRRQEKGEENYNRRKKVRRNSNFLIKRSEENRRGSKYLLSGEEEVNGEGFCLTSALLGIKSCPYILVCLFHFRHREREREREWEGGTALTDRAVIEKLR